MTDEAKAQAERLNKAEQFLHNGNLASLFRQQDYYNKAHYVSSPLPYGQVADLFEKQAAELAKFKALAETLARALGEAMTWNSHDDEGVPAVWLDQAADALLQYKEATQ